MTMTKSAEHEATRISVTIRLSLLLLAWGSLIGGCGLFEVSRQAAWGDITLGVGVGLLFSAGLAGYMALRERGKDVHCVVLEN